MACENAIYFRCKSEVYLILLFLTRIITIFALSYETVYKPLIKDNMIQSFKLVENGTTKQFSIEIPTLSHPMLPFSYVDPRGVRPYVFHDFSRYVFEEAPDFPTDFQRLVQLANSSASYSRIERFKKALLNICDEHIKRCNRLVFSDLLMYVDCMGFACLATGEMNSSNVKSNYGKWAKMVVDQRGYYVKSSTHFGPGQFQGSQNQEDLLSCQ